VVSGGLAFATSPAAPASSPEAAEGTRFTLFPSRDTALAPPDGPALPVRMVFTQNTRGLAPGAPVDVLGVEVGRVTAVNLRHDPGRERFAAEVLAELFPRRLGIRGQAGLPDDDRQLMKALVERGLRAQMRTANLFTGQMTVALYFPTSEKPTPGSFDTTAETPTMPSMPSQFNALQPQLMQIVKRLSEVRFDEIGQGVQQTLRSANAAIEQLSPQAQRALADVQKTLQQAERTLSSAQQTLQKADRSIASDDSALQRNAQQTMDELQRAARAMRLLADYLQSHPEALLRGKPDELPYTDPYHKP